MHSQTTGMSGIKKNYELPEKVINTLKNFSEETGVGMQRVVAAGVALVCQLTPTARDELMRGYLKWLNDESITVVTDDFFSSSVIDLKKLSEAAAKNRVAGRRIVGPPQADSRQKPEGA